jgi:hypothetical protein
MSSALKSNRDRPFGSSRTVDFDERPLCPWCVTKMKIRDTSKLRTIIDLQENIHIRTRYYRCFTPDCLGREQPYTIPPNPYVPPKGDYSYNIYAKVAELRWKHHKTYQEIIDTLKQEHSISICLNTVENMLKIYEIGCAEKYKPYYFEKIKSNGGIILTIDGMAPMKGNKSLYVVYDHQTGLTLAAERLKNQKASTINSFLRRVKQRIDDELDVKVKAIISDALPSQRIAIQQVFPEIPHCLCHYHFYALVLKAPKAIDSNIMTQIRASLRKMYDLKKYLGLKQQKKPYTNYCEFLVEILKILEALSQWKRKPKDPCFSGLLLYSRVSDIYEKMIKAVQLLDKQQIPCEEEKVVRRIHRDLEKILKENQKNALELTRINESLKKIKKVLSDLDLNYKEGLVQLRKVRDQFRERSRAKNCGECELVFIEAIRKYIRTKIEFLFNYKKVNGAPTTNNSHELQFKQLKHFLRRVIGFSAAKRYLLTHGERIVFVNPKESRELILLILQKVDYTKARSIIQKERFSRDSLRLILHQQVKWESKLERVDDILRLYELPLLIIN